MNAKLCKMLRRMVRNATTPGTPEHKLLGKPVRNSKGETVCNAVNAQGTYRGAYLRLKEACEQNPEVLERVKQTAAYVRMLEEEKKRGGPVFDRGGP